MDDKILFLKYWVNVGVEDASHDVNRIIMCGERRPVMIETVLDTLLGYMHLGKGEDEFRLLNKYYSMVNEKNATVYDQLYEEIFAEEI